MASPPPVTVKMRMGIDADHLTYLVPVESPLTLAGVAWVYSPCTDCGSALAEKQTGRQFHNSSIT